MFHLPHQHYLTMFGSTVAIPLLMAKPLGLDDKPTELGWLIATMFFVSGITTLLQTSFGMRANAVKREPELQAFWKERQGNPAVGYGTNDEHRQ